MQTHFTPAQLSKPGISVANEALRKCVHCGFCTATCPTYVLRGDELDSPRGRIYLIKDMLEGDKPASEKVVKHVDRCLSCLSCMTTCPASVNYMHLVDHARVHIEKTYTRPLGDRLLRKLLAMVLPYPARFRLSLLSGWFVKPIANLLPGRLSGMIKAVPLKISNPSSVDRPQTFDAENTAVKRVVLMTGCAQQVLAPSINEATVRLLSRHGCDVVIAEGGGCCGALVHHMGKEDEAIIALKNNILAWEQAEQQGALDAIVINASGCGTTVKDYGFMLRDDPEWAERARHMSELAKDITEFMSDLDLQPSIAEEKPVVAYHSACSMQHGQQIKDEPKNLLRAAGFEVREPKESHLCCGSAGTYNIMQPELADELQARKVANLTQTGASVVATGNIGCLMQIGNGMENTPVVHTVELLDWATGGPKPEALR
jgi:glycolate oxidase iron-sulfur subunit